MPCDFSGYFSATSIFEFLCWTSQTHDMEYTHGGGSGHWFKTCLLALCWKQVKQVSQSTSTFLTARSTRSFLICLAVLKRTVASWRDPRENAACCGRSWNAGCWVASFSTRLSTELQLGPQHFHCSVSIPPSLHYHYLRTAICRGKD